MLWPPIAQFRLVLVATGYGTANGLEIAVMLASCAAAAAAAAWFAVASLKTELGK
jgi:hypothetical protein